MPQALAGWGSCDQAEGRDLAPVRPEALAWAHDADGNTADLMTRPNFGCVMHEPKAEA